MRDPRVLQIGLLTSLLAFVTWHADFAPDHRVIVIYLLTCVGTQKLCDHLVGRRGSIMSAVITALGLSLLLRTGHLGVGAGVAVIAISSKYIFRDRDGHHFLNPSNFAVVAALSLVPEQVWLATGQWGRYAWFAFLVSSMGWLILSRSKRLDVSLAFLSSFAVLAVAQGMILGDPWAIVWHGLSHGSLLIFSYYMITDPMTTPRRRSVRIGFGVAVAVMATAWNFWWRTPGGIFYALFVASCFTPILNRLWNDEPLSWQRLAGWERRPA